MLALYRGNFMASQEQVRDFLAHWFQLGKPIVLAEDRGEYLPNPIYHQGTYSQSFEDCWHNVMVTSGQGCYLKGTTQTVADMLSPAWVVTSCARCDMPLAIPELGMTKSPCPCDDLSSWPNYDVPVPRTAVDSDRHLSDIQRRIENASGPDPLSPRDPYEAEETSVFSAWRAKS